MEEPHHTGEDTTIGQAVMRPDLVFLSLITFPVISFIYQTFSSEKESMYWMDIKWQIFSHSGWYFFRPINIGYTRIAANTSQANLVFHPVNYGLNSHLADAVSPPDLWPRGICEMK